MEATRHSSVARTRPDSTAARIKESEYLLQLQEKQKARFTYGVMEKQFRLYYKEANNRPGKTGENLLRILESRLDNVVYRAGLARTRRQARQLVTHGHLLVNNKKVDIPSYRVSQYDIIDVKEKSLSTLPFQVARETVGDRPVPGWLQVVGSRLRILVHQLPERADRHRSAGTAHRRVLLEVRRFAPSEWLRSLRTPQPLTGPQALSHRGRQIVDVRTGGNTNAHFSATHADRRGHR
ncbi:hypothetical protein GCM10020255_065090 [Rhodococcus baikonurensis]